MIDKIHPTRRRHPQLPSIRERATGVRSCGCSEPLCGLSAEWVVELVPGVDNWLPLANFSPVTFTEAAALDNNGQAYWPQGANITEIHTKDGPVTSVSLGENSVTINYA
ncbi:hypothetical protein L210DRAFT_3768461 [Boletus edulis BED1]|uniref:Uncharacterized protein n=1 Tax=Boletus edulis BED1 TaxID=1328754 RepID=A0AAD4BB51_BOLED|nr:hypothetical protein L210DRAFT_3768461 [Boletus edulis BED1]